MSVSVRRCLTPTWAAQLIRKSLKLRSFWRLGVGVHRIPLPSIILHSCASRASIQLAPASCVSAQLRRAAQIPTGQYALLHRFMSCPRLCYIKTYSRGYISHPNDPNSLQIFNLPRQSELVVALSSKWSGRFLSCLILRDDQQPS
jgi:hypothetical protein